MPGAMEFEFSTGGGASRPLDKQPFSLLLLGHYGALGADDAATAPIRRVDIDTIDDLWERFEPRIELEIDGLEIVFEPRDLDDFHPDELIRRLPAFEQLRQLRRRLLDPATATEALEDVMRSRGGKAHGSGASPENDEAARPDSESGDDMMTRLLGERPAGTDNSTPTRSSGLDALIRSAVAPHIVEDSDPRADAAVDSVDLGLAQLMRRVLADPAFQALEARWRSLFRLVQEVETDETLEIRVGNITRRALLAALPSSAESLQDCALHGLLIDRHRLAADDRTPSLLAIDSCFGDGPDDLALLGSLGSLAEIMNASVIAGAEPGLVGAADAEALGNARDWDGVDQRSPLWSTLQAAPFARRVGLVLPRLLARLPYGADTDPVSAFSFEEIRNPNDGGFLWGCPVPAVCEGLLKQFTREAWSMSPGAAMDIEDLPVFSYREDGESKMQPVTECLMPESAVEAALERGVMPLAGYRNQDRARLVRVQSIASPPTSLLGPWSD